MTCDRCPLSLLCLSGEIVLSTGYYCTKCQRFNLNLDGNKRNTFSCTVVKQRAAVRYPHPFGALRGYRICLHCTMSQVVFFDHDLNRRVLYERRTQGARLKLKDFMTGKRISAQERDACR